MPRLIPALTQFKDAEGNPLDSGKLYFYETQSVSTKKSTFSNSDESENSKNENPVILSAEGYAGDIFGTGAYKSVLKDQDDITIQGPFDPLIFTSSLLQFGVWDKDIVYDEFDIVRGSDIVYYRSRIALNSNNNPSNNRFPVQWEIFDIGPNIWLNMTGDITTYGWKTQYIDYTQGGTNTITLHASPKHNDMVVVFDYTGTFNSTNVNTVSADGKDIWRTPGPRVLNRQYGKYFFIFDVPSNAWKYTAYGV